MGKKVLIIFGLILMSQQLYSAEIGFGVIVGNPTGLSAKYWLGKDKKERAIDLTISWSANKTSTFYFHSDWLIHKYNLVKVKDLTGKLPVYYGCGVKLSSGGETIFGVRIPLGVEYIFEEIPFDLFAEAAPVINLTPSVKIDLNAGIGIRMFFDVKH